MKKKLLISSNTAWSIFNFRVDFVNHLINEGYEVIILTSRDEYATKIKNLLDAKCIFIPIRTLSKNPFFEFITLLYYFYYFIKIRPQFFLGFTHKSNIYGSIISIILGIPYINNIAGLGSVFKDKTITTYVLMLLYKFICRFSYQVIFQNEDDMKLFIENKLVNNNIELVPGSGVNINKFFYSPIDISQREFNITFLFFSRLIREKGIFDFVKASKILLKKYKKIKFNIVGFINPNDKRGVSLDQINQWEKENKNIKFFGQTDDIGKFIRESHCVVLPTYYPEGTPRSLLESASIGRPIITTNTPGCRNVIIENQSGFFCKINDPEDLSKQMEKFINMDLSEIARMGEVGAKMIRVNFNEEIIFNIYQKLINSKIG